MIFFSHNTCYVLQTTVTARTLSAFPSDHLSSVFVTLLKKYLDFH